MSNLLWKYYLEDDVEKFRRLLANTSQSTQYTPRGHGGGVSAHGNSWGALGGSPGGFATSPRTAVKHRKASGHNGISSATKGGNTVLSRADLNSRDHSGLTVLHRACSSTAETALNFAMALIEHPLIDLYVQDTESGWTALHRALYFGHTSIARAIINRDTRDPSVPTGNVVTKAGQSVIKIKDREGNTPFDVYNATIARRTLQRHTQADESDDESQEEDAETVTTGLASNKSTSHFSIDGDEVFAFGSNKNLTLGFGDEDDRQHPEKITLKRPDHLLFRFYQEHNESLEGTTAASHNLPSAPKSVKDLPSLIQARPIIIQDVALSKLHSAILTTDPESNLYVCGFGPGGRLGTGDEQTSFNYVCIEQGGLAGKKVVTVALGQNHTLAVDSEGEIFSWGTNTYGQLGYTLPRPSLKDEEPVCSTPRQIFGPLKREAIIGVAASAIHSVAHTSTSLFTWGKNEGQLGLMDSDSRSLEFQTVPRKVAASLFKSPIVMVSAINRATTCLLANHTVCVFTNYGYNIVKFPLHEGFTNYHLKSAVLTTRYEAESNHISSITSGGDTIAALSSRGDLFTVNVSQKLDTNPTATSTTNPSKIKGALSSPQRVWSLRKGNWDGIQSVGVAENGSVIVCTKAGAVWRRVKRAKIKDTYTGSGGFNQKDFKFQRVSGLTNVAAVRSNPFGVYAAIRKDCDVTKSQVLVNEKTLWEDLAPLLSIRDLQASELSKTEETDAPRFWVPALPKEHFDPLKRAVLMSPDLEADVQRHLLGVDFEDEGYNMELCTTISDVKIPIHTFILASRSTVFRSAMNEFRRTGSAVVTELFMIETSTDENKARIIFQGLDFFTIVNLAIYMYTDAVVDVWHFVRHAPTMAFRYRQVRTELMKIASHLKVSKLEAAVRLMSEPEPQLDVDMTTAIQDPNFFEDGDVIVELDDDTEVIAHTSLVCQRCPFFQGMFKGRAGGQWLAGRQEEDGPVRVDLKHIEYNTFQLVLRYLYSDCGPELFEDVVSDDIDAFSDLVLDCMAVANELMLGRLSQICQQVIGRFVTTRNICHLLNAVAPCSVTEFKDAGLEYMCLQLESMLEGHLLDDLDEDLLLELDEVVQGNQLNCLPFVKSGRAELLLHERHPGLAEDIDEERQRRIRDMTFRTNLKEEDNRLSSSFRARVGSLDDMVSGSPSQEKARRKSKAARNAPFSPSIRPKDSTADLMFDMDDEDALVSRSPTSPVPFSIEPKTPPVKESCPKAAWGYSEDTQGRSTAESPIISMPNDYIPNKEELASTSGPKKWSSPVMSSKLDMREIMAQTSNSRTSNLSMSLSAQKVKAEAAAKATTPKLSQKERKKQQALQQTSIQPRIILDKTTSDGKPSSPWQVATGAKTSLKDVLDSKKSPQSGTTSKTPSLPVSPQTLPSRRTASPDTRFAGQRRTVSNMSTPVSQTVSPGPSRTASGTSLAKPIPLMPHSKSYQASTAKAEPSLQLSMADIIGLQRREQEVIKEAAAKRSLQEIQEEQAFQEWWDQESKRAQEEEEAAKARAIASANNASKTTSSGRGKTARGRGGRGRGESRGRGRGRGQEKVGNNGP
ncbi:BTB/POZ domain-containing protein 1 [Phlyctema vagabunda]|uniref:BTB/POZ domain-containing protein 1 n=1 Tax=Phlyctema vagabunda TaxID=108571 RepID=A0ABR4PF78_9HELO